MGSTANICRLEIPMSGDVVDATMIDGQMPRIQLGLLRRKIF